jgi:hypothetical protein
MTARQLAAAEGERFYSSDKACPQGHIALRLVKNGECARCAALALERYQAAISGAIHALRDLGISATTRHSSGSIAALRDLGIDLSVKRGERQMTMVGLNLGQRGACRQSWSRTNLRPAILELLKEHPDASDDELHRLLMALGREDDDFYAAVMAYVLANQVAVLKRYAHDTKQRTEGRAAMRAAVRESIVAQILLLNQTLTNGKKARFCTREEIEAHADAQAFDAAGWRRIAKRMPAGKLLGQALNEDEARALYNK